MKLTKFFHKILSNKSQTTKPYQSLAWASTCTIVTGACLASLIPEYYISDLSLRLSTYRRLGDLREYKKHKSVTPSWCGTCHALIEYFVEVDINQTLGFYEKSN